MNIAGKGKDSAAMIDFLLGDDARWITAQQVSVDEGGRAAIHPLPKS